MRLTHEALEGAYNFLLAAYPFCKWKMPEPDDLAFRVSGHNDRYAHFEYDRGPFPTVAVSEKLVKTREDLLSSMAHEMIHAYQWKHKLASKRVQHNKDYRRRAKIVCRELDFDPKTF